jgi:hypothetical protein
VVVGRTNASFTINQVVRTTASFTGPIFFTSPAGTLTAQVAGTFDVASGAFRATSTSIAGTGLLRGVAGSVTLAGLEDFAPCASPRRSQPALLQPSAPGWVNGVVVASSTKPSRWRIGRLSAEASTCR